MRYTNAMWTADRYKNFSILNFTREETEILRRAQMTLHRWSERECGDDNGCLERDDATGKVVWRSAHSGRTSPVADLETGALKRGAAVIAARNERNPGAAVFYYHQTDPRGCSLYIIRPGDVPQGRDVESYYTNGIAVVF